MRNIKKAIREGHLRRLQLELADTGPRELADEMLRLDGVDQAIMFRLLSKDRALSVFEKLDPVHQQALLDGLQDDEVIDLVERLPTDDRARLLDEMPAKVAAQLLERVDPIERRRTALLLGHASESAGRIMSPDYVSIVEDRTAAEALATVRRSGFPPETIAQLYVLDRARRLVGVVSLAEVVLAPDEATTGSIMASQVVSSTTDEDQEDVARRMIANDLLALPVLDRENRLVGVVTLDDALDVLSQEDTEDVARMGGAVPLNQPYLTASAFSVYRSRVGWLMILFVAEAFTGTILRSFESTLESVVALSFFVPLLIDTGGNAGSQTTTTIVRAMAVGEVRLSDLLRVMWKEMRVGLMLGITMAAAGLVRAITWGTGETLSLVVGMSLVSVVVLATFIGSILPILLKRFRLDPAVVSAPFITTFVDTLGLLIYFLLARAMLGV